MVKDMHQLGKYRILSELGRGGFATVYRALDTTLEREVALKVLDPLLMRDDAFVERFKQEARAAAALQHPNLVTIFDLGEADERLYIAEEYLPGGDLRRRLAGGPLLLPDVVAIVEQIGAALDYAHEQGMIHRDVKPGNILFDARGRAKLSDFGIARVLSGTRFTTTGATLGTPEYMAPEQAESGELDGRTDVYALGVVAYEMLTGRVPFSGETPSVVHYKHVHEPPRSPSEVDPAVPQEVSAVILTALEKRRENRYATHADFTAALGAALAAHQRAEWQKGLVEIEDLIARGEFDQATERAARMGRQRPDDAALRRLQARIEEEIALAATYAEACQHLDAARDKARQVLAARPG